MDDDALRKEKLSKLLEIEGYESVEDLIEAVLSDAVSPAICMNETAPSRARWSRIRTPATARSAQQLNAISTYPRRPHLTAEHRPRRVLSWAFLLLDFQLQVPAFTWRFA